MTFEFKTFKIMVNYDQSDIMKGIIRDIFMSKKMV